VVVVLGASYHLSAKGTANPEPSKQRMPGDARSPTSVLIGKRGDIMRERDVPRMHTPAADYEIDKLMPSVLPWLHEAGNPYFDWLFGGADVALPIIASRMRSPSSEVSIRDAILFLDDGGGAIGGFIAFSGAELGRRRKADAIAYLRSVGKARRDSLLHRMQASRDMFATVRPDEFYLSKVGVRPDARGLGYGRALVEKFLSIGVSRGHRNFVLDVSGENAEARFLYESMGFRVSEQSRVLTGAITYVTMRSMVVR
jgi:ribosomal protein S18 acetylase RimI-like enzyme